MKNNNQNKIENNPEEIKNKSEIFGAEENVEEIPIGNNKKEEVTSENVEIKKDIKKKEREDQESEKMIELRNATEKSRLKYARKSYEINSIFLKLKGAFGKHLKTDPKEVDVCYEQYKKALNELKNQALEEISSNPNLTPEARRKELGELIKFFNIDEKLDLFSAYTAVGAESFEKSFGKFPGWFAKSGAAFLKYYRKQHWSLKMAGGAALTFSGLGLVNRLFSGAAAGTGIAMVMEAKHRKKEGDIAEEKKEALLEGLEHVEKPVDKTEFINSWLEKEIDGLDKDLRTERRETYIRYATGILAGTLVGSGALSHVIHETLDRLGITGALSEAAKHMDASKEVSQVVGDGSSSHVEALLPQENSQSLSGDEVVPDVPEHIDLDVAEGSSFEKEIRIHLEGTGIGREEAGKLAHRMSLDYIGEHPDAATHNYNLIHPGAQIELSPAGDRITGFHDSLESKVSSLENHINTTPILETPPLQETVKLVDLGDGKMQPMEEYLKNSTGAAAIPEAILEKNEKFIPTPEIPAAPVVNERVLESAASVGVAAGGVFGLRRLWDKFTKKKPVTAPFSIPVKVEDNASESVKVPEVGSESVSKEENKPIESDVKNSVDKPEDKLADEGEKPTENKESVAKSLVDNTIDERKREEVKVEGSRPEKTPVEKKTIKKKEMITEGFVGRAFLKKENYDIRVNVIEYAGERDGKHYMLIEEIDGESGNRSEALMEDIYLSLEVKKNPEKKKPKESDNLSFFKKRFSTLFERQDKIQAMISSYPDLEKEKIDNEIEGELRKLYLEIRNSEKNIRLSKRAKKNVNANKDAGEVIQHRENQIATEKEKLAKNRKLCEEIEKKLGKSGELFNLKEQCKLDFREMIGQMTKLVKEKEKTLDLKGDDLAKIITENPESGVGKVYRHYARILGENIARPHPDEDVFYWSGRFVREIFDSKGIAYNMKKRTKAKLK